MAQITEACEGPSGTGATVLAYVTLQLATLGVGSSGPGP
jgi:hypothetical protein